MKAEATLRAFLLAASTLLATSSAHATTYTWDNSNVTGTPASPLDWFTSGPNSLGLWTGAVVPVSNNTNTIQFFANNTTALTNTGTNTQISNINNGAAFELGTLTLSGKGSATTARPLTMTISGDALNFSAATGTINLSAANGTGTSTITYNINSNIQLGTASSADALTITGTGTGTFNIGGLISELQTGGGSLIKSGSSIVNLSNTGNSYSGGTTLSGGVLQIAGDGSLGATSGNILFSGSAAIQSGVLALTLSSGRTITMNSGATAIFQAQHVNNTGKQFNFAGKITGDGGIQAYDDYTLGQYNVYLTGTTNDFKGSIGLGNLTTSGGVVNLHLASLVDDATHNGNIIFGLVGTAPVFDYTGSTALTLDNRRVELASTKGGVLQNTGAGVMTVNTNLLVSGTGNQTFTLGGTNTGANTFSGDITSVSGKLITLAKAGTGKWNVSGDISGGGGVSMAGGSASTLILSGTNTYSGATTTPTSVGGTLIFQGLQALSSNTAITQNQVSTGGTQMRLLDDSSASSTVNFTLNTVNGSGIGNSGNTIFVGNNGTANGGSNASSTATNETISIGKLTMINNATSGGSNWAGWGSIQGANGYRLLINSVDLPTLTGVTPDVTAYFVPTTANVTLAGTIRQPTANAARQLTLQLDGTSSGNLVTGNIQDSGDVTPKALNLTKGNTSTWTLSGTNSYTGTTAVQAGTLIAGMDSLASTNGAFGNSATDVNLGVAGGNSDTGILIGGAYNVGRNIRLLTNNTTDAGTRVLTLGGSTANNSEFSGNIYLGTNSQAGRGVTLTAAAGGQVTFSGVIQNPTSMDATSYTVTKAGTGTVILTNTNTYTGATNVNGGTLVISSTGSTDAGSAVTVTSGALVVNGTVNGTLTANSSTTVSGSGTVHGAATVSGALNPGNSPGLLTFDSSLAMVGTTATTMQIDSLGMNRGTDYDGIDIGTTLTYGGTLTLDLGATFGAGNYTFNLFDFGSQSGSLTSVALAGLYSGSLTDNGFGVWGLTDGGNTWSFTQGTGDLSLAVIPEPNVAAVLGGLGMLALLRRRR